ncbi:gluconokinase [Oceanobacillus massiliensis]|uniref:gluconokinase n=1 Tax=Oceanobacillus massiliensis TaxID=1465765 RepID=UPI000289F1E2|nr:gluconokinase [Oceanobacillus massiliensis]
MKRKLAIGLDIGTTSAKAVAFDLKGKLIAEAEERLTTIYPQSGWVEQNPDEVEKACRIVMNKIIQEVGKGHELLAAGISCAMHSLICMDENVKPLSNMLIWSDGRSCEQAERIGQSTGMDIYSRTGTPIHPMTPLMKLIWMRENKYEAYEKAAYYMTFKEYLLHKWFGNCAIDYSMASSTGLMNIKTLDWDEEALDLAGIKREQLSRIVPPTEIFSSLDKAIAEETGIPADMPFIIGAADGQLANLGSGATSPGEVNVSVGTSGAIRQFVTGTPVNDEMETFTYAFTKDTSIIGGPTNNGGIALQWFKDMIEFKGTHDELLAGAENVEPGSDGIIFLPYINGERAPLWNQRARGNFYGLCIGHERDHLARAVLEGIVFNIYQIGKSLEKMAGEPRKITVNGGLSKSPLWVQIMADVFGSDIYLSDTHHNAAWGAAWTALVGIGAAESFDAIKENLPAETVIKPNMANHEVYIKIYERYEKIAEDLHSYFI